MFSVKQRIRNAHKIGQYTDFNLTTKHLPDDGIDVQIQKGDHWLVGLAVDYLVRLVSGKSPIEAFSISLKGAMLVNETDKALSLLDKVDPSLGDATIISACKLCGYDVAYRRSPILFENVDSIKPTRQIILAIRTLVNRTVSYLNNYGGITDTDVTFDGAYTKIVSSGDCDYLTEDTLWDLKVTSKEVVPPQYTLQLMMYYIMGVLSIHKDRFSKIKHLAILNPLLKTAYFVDVSKIDFKLGSVAHSILGFKIDDDWRNATTLDEEIYQKITQGLSFNFTEFNVDEYKDGIYDISKDDYLTYYYPIARQSEPFRWTKPSLDSTKKIKFLKNDGFIMFISITYQGKLRVLRGGAIRNLTHDIEYYFQNLPRYCRKVLNLFGNYRKQLYAISDALKQIKDDPNFIFQYPDLYYQMRHESLSPRVHGSIIDLNSMNHLYVNPIDGRIIGYSARNETSRDVYPDILELIAGKLPTYYKDFRQRLITGKLPALLDTESKSLTLLEDSSKPPKLKARTLPVAKSMFERVRNNQLNIVHMEGTEMYKISTRLYRLQSIYDHHLVTEWYDSFLEEDKSDTSDLLKITF